MSSEDRAPSDSDRPLKIYSITMCRNEADILPYFFAQLEELFDKVFIIDAQSTDGTLEYIEAKAAKSNKIKLFSIRKEEKYPGAIFNAFARLAAAEGADWTFFLDVDEFIRADGRQQLETYLREFSGSVMRMPLINLIPTQYGTFRSFDADQHFHWIGRASNDFKIAVSAAFVASHPQFYMNDGSYDVLRDFSSGTIEPVQEGLTLLHVPIRSADRFKYKTMNAQKSLRAKRNKSPADATGVFNIVSAVENAQTLDDRHLSHVVAFYGDSAPSKIVDSIEGSWLKTGLNNFNFKIRGLPAASSLGETMSRDRTLTWIKPEFLTGAMVCATITADKVIIKPQPIRGNGEIILNTFSSLPGQLVDAPVSLEPTDLVDMLNAAFTKIDVLSSSEWAELVPTLFGLFSIAKPRRFVELGTRRGLSFFAACQASKFVETDTQCIAVDSWMDGSHIDSNAETVFDVFRSDLKSMYPDHYFIRSEFSQAVDCFDDHSIDLLHIKDCRTATSIKSSFDAWLPKMTDAGVIMVHNINVHDRGFGVWQFWNDVKEAYPHLDILHSQGLGIICTNENKTRLRLFCERFNGDLGDVVRQAARLVGQLSVDHKVSTLDFKQVTFDLAQVAAERDEVSLRADQLYAETVRWSADYDAEKTLSDARDAEIQRLNGEYAKLGELSDARDAEIRRLNGEYAKLGELSDARDAEIRRLNNEYAKLIAVSDVQNAEIKSRDSEIMKLQQDQIALGVELKTGMEERTRLQVKLNEFELLERDLVRKQVGLLSVLRQRRAPRFLEALQKRARPAASETARSQALTAEIDLIRMSKEFDDEFYLTKYRDVAEAGLDPIWHYVMHGADEGRNPSKTFDTVDFAIKNPDVFDAGVTPLTYHIQRRKDGNARASH